MKNAEKEYKVKTMKKENYQNEKWRIRKKEKRTKKKS